MLISSNRAVTEWGEVFGDQVVATAILDRMLHHSHVLTIRGESYRLREKRRSGLLRPQAGGSSSAVIGGVPPPITADEVKRKDREGTHRDQHPANTSRTNP